MDIGAHGLEQETQMEKLKIMSWSEAKKIGSPTYFTNKLCKNGHVSFRHTINGSCDICQKKSSKKHRDKNRDEINLKNRINARKWWVENKDKESVKNDRKKYREKNRDRISLGKKIYRVNNLEKIKKINADYYQKNKEIIGPKVRASYKLYYFKNRKKLYEAKKIWRAKNPEKSRAQVRNRRAKQKINGSHTGDEIKQILHMQRGCCAVCRVKVVKYYHVDHIIPISKGGRNDSRNLQILCRECNLVKGSKMPNEFMRQQGFLI